MKTQTQAQQTQAQAHTQARTPTNTRTTHHSTKPVLWSLFLGGLAVAPVLSYAVDGTQGVAATIVTGLIAFQARVAIVELDRRQDRGPKHITA
jgi:predicted lipid-binding transport protein (Tim44 family)